MNHVFGHTVFIIFTFSIQDICAHARLLPQSDDPLCRDDLCIEKQLQNGLDNTGYIDGNMSPGPTNEATTSATVLGFQCPPTYRKVVRNGIEFCEPMTKSEMAMKPTKKMTCPDGETLTQSGSRQKCVPTSKRTVKCNPGHLPVQLEDKVLCVEPDPDYLHFCPPAHLRVFADGQLKCYPIFNSPIRQKVRKNTPPTLNKRRKGRKRRKKQRSKMSKSFLNKAGKSKTIPFNKGNSTKTYTRGFNEKQLTGVECGNGKVPALTAAGYVCTEPVFPAGVCPEDQVPSLSAEGIDCVSCPLGQGTVNTKDGVKCSSQSTAPSLHPVIAPQPPLIAPQPPVIVPSSPLVPPIPTIDVTEPPVAATRCPEGLVPVETAVGMVCQYVPPSIPQAEPDCPPGQRAVNRNREVMCEKSAKICGPGQVAIETMSGETVCGFDSGTGGKQKIQCPPGLVLIDDQCVYGPDSPAVDKANPCPVGQTLMKTAYGLKCFHDGLNSNSKCEARTVLTKTSTGFVCQPIELHLENVPFCGQGFVAVRIAHTFECITIYEADLVCKGSDVLVRTQSGFVCRSTKPKPKPKRVVCGAKQVLTVDEYGSATCISVHDANERCGKGYNAVSRATGFVCRKIKLDFSCPPGFTLQLATSPPSCISVSDPECIQGVSDDCMGVVPGPLPCENGYDVGTDDQGQGCFLSVPQPDIDFGAPATPDQDFSPPITDKGVAIKGSETTPIIEPCGEEEGAIRPCDLDISILLAGCNPDCANGGTCVDGVCSCPSGITGSACHVDLDECRAPDRGSCEYSCENTFGSYHCSCPTGYMLSTDGVSCTVAGCIPDCLNNGECRNGQCLCQSGFEGDHCQFDKDECEMYKGRMCQHQCRNTYGGYQCVCPPGSRLNTDGRTCINTTCIPECKNGGSCEHSKCNCPAGFNGIICQFDVNECYKKKPCHQQCINTRGSYRCTCNHGYTLNIDGHTCRPV